MPLLDKVESVEMPLFRRGKVRDSFIDPDGSLWMVATDRISAFDVVLPTAIPDKGRVLTQMSKFWFAKTAAIVGNHLLSDEDSHGLLPPEWLERTMHVRRAQRIDVECVVRGYLSGSGWKEYRRSSTLAGEQLPPGLLESCRLPEPRFTPAIKNDSGHDENVSRARLAQITGGEMAGMLEQTSLRIYDLAERHCRDRGIILADTKFEFGLIDGKLCLIDELLTPDSSRFWELTRWREGEPAVAFDKQYVRDYLETLDWDKAPPGPELPAEVVAATRTRYLQAAQIVCDLDLEN